MCYRESITSNFVTMIDLDVIGNGLDIIVTCQESRFVKINLLFAFFEWENDNVLKERVFVLFSKNVSFPSCHFPQTTRTQTHYTIQSKKKITNPITPAYHNKTELLEKQHPLSLSLLLYLRYYKRWLYLYLISVWFDSTPPGRSTPQLSLPCNIGRWKQ